MKNVTNFSIRLYRWLARSFPEDFLRAHGENMVQLSEDLIREAAARGRLSGFLPLMARLLADLLWRSAVEHAIAFRQDVYYGARMLRRAPWLTVACTVSLGIGIGMSTSTYQSIRSYYFKEVPGVGDVAELVRVQESVSYPAYEAFRDHSGKFSATTAYMAPVPFLITVKGRAQRVWGHLVAPNYFDVLHVRMSVGAAFHPENRHRDSAPEVVVSRRLWENRLGADPSLIGHDLKINGQAATVVGVADAGFLGASPLAEVADLWIPVSAQPKIAPELAKHPLEDRHIAVFRMLGRLQQGVSMADAESTLDGIARRLEQENHDPGRERKGRRITLAPGGRLIPLRDQDRAAASAFPAVLIGLLLWVACSNVANLLLARAAGRRREIAVRRAMGAGRWRIIRQLLTESVMLSLLGGAAGFVLALWSNRSTDWFRPVLPEYMNLHVDQDWSMLVFGIAISGVTGILFGLAPALHATKEDIAPALKGGALNRFPAFRWFSTRNLIVVQQLAASLMLLLLTGFIMLGIQRSTAPDLGFNPHLLYRMSIDPVREGYRPEAAPAFLAKVLDLVKHQPGVQSAVLSLSAPLEPFGSTHTSGAGNLNDKAASFLMHIETSRVGAGFFETAEVPLLVGRSLRESDEKEDSHVAVVNKKLANDLFPQKSAVGQVLEADGNRFEIVGVVEDIRSSFVFNIPQRRAYLPFRPSDLTSPGPMGIALLVRAAPGVAVDVSVRQAVNSLDSNLTLFDVSPMDDRVAGMMSLVRMTLFIYGGIGLFSLILAAVGLAGVTMYAVAQRGQEIGIRMALGARTADVMRLVMREGTWLVIAGTAIGLACTFGMLRVLNRILDVMAQITATSTSDPRLVIGAPVLLAALTMLACYLPARRSMRIDPVAALRHD